MRLLPHQFPPLELHFSFRHPAYAKQRSRLKAVTQKAIHATLKHMPQTASATVPIEVSVLLSDDAALRQLNRDFRGKDKPTNVLSFPSRHRERSEGSEVLAPADEEILRFAQDDNYLGDIAISLDTITREAAEQGKKFDAHLAHMCVHGTLHLLGLDHETDAEAEAMESKEIIILQYVGYKNPYALNV